MSKKKPKYTAFFFANGNAAFCKDGQQVTELQPPWFLEWVKVLQAANIDLFDVEYNFQGIEEPARLFKTSDGSLNWTFNPQQEKINHETHHE